MPAFSHALQSFSLTLRRLITPPAHPTRVLVRHRVRLFAAVGAGGTSGLIFLVVYYLTLGLLPAAFSYPTTTYPVDAWAHRMDLAQFAGSFLYPPLPTPLTWWLGLAVLFGTLTVLGVVYALGLAWALQTSDTVKGVGFGVALFFGLALTLTFANGVHPAIMRNVLPDTGVFLIGWSFWATLQLFLVHLIYGACLGTLYRRLTLKD